MGHDYLIHNLRNQYIDGNSVFGREMRKEAADLITSLLARAEEAEKELSDCRDKNAGLVMALLTEQPPNPDCLGDREWQEVRNHLRSVRDRAEAAEARCKRLDEARERANEACAKWEYRAEKAERERDAAVEQLHGDCEKCAHYKVTWNGCTPDFECPLSDRCLNRDLWEWNGGQKEE